MWSCGFACLALLAPAAASAYAWPVRPFYQPHAIRGYFSDPRLSGPETGFHFGVDIVAEDATPVYAIEPGRVRTRGETVSIFPRRRGGHQLSYWHVVPVVGNRQLVRRHQLIGYVAAGAGHVHLAEYREGTYVNPLRIGGLAPYIDDTVPQIPALRFYSFGRAIRPELVSGVVDVTVEAYDPSPLQLPEGWTQARLSPAEIRWQILQGQNIIRPWERPVDFRTFLLPFSLFDFVYAPPTFQNRLNRPGRYEYYLAHEFDTRFLANGSYVLQVEALDTQENLAQASFAFTFTN
jgi:murein DD-endopeptidase MepM/ murein hydrolase activator NlpD